jgi:hypothetical protein
MFNKVNNNNLAMLLNLYLYFTRLFLLKLIKELLSKWKVNIYHKSHKNRIKF